MLTSDDPTVVEVPQDATILTGSDLTHVALKILQQADNFTAKAVTITANYAGKTLTHTIRVVPPKDLLLPELVIDVMIAGNPCQDVFVEGSVLMLAIKNINVFSNRLALEYKWSVLGAAVAKDDTSELSITSLPTAGTKVVVEVSVTNSINLHAKGQYEFVTKPRLTNLEELERLVMCRVHDLKQMNAHIPPWIPIKDGRLKEVHLVIIEEQCKLAVREMGQVISLVKQLRSMRAKTME
jgi:hypothetical protein